MALVGRFLKPPSNPLKEIIMITVKVAKIGTTTREVTLDDGANVDEALAAAETTLPEGYVVKVDNAVASGSTVLSDNSLVVLSKDAKSNS